MKTVTIPQIKKIHTLLNNIGALDDKKEIIMAFTGGRTESTKELSLFEARDLIQQLSHNDPREKHRKAVVYLAYKAGIIYGNTKEDYQMNRVKLNMFLKERGAIKKDLEKMDLLELKQTHKQFEAIIRNNNKSKDNKDAKRLADALLNELGIVKQ